MALSEHDWKIIKKYAAEITWAPGSQGVCDGLSGQAGEDAAAFINFIEGGAAAQTFDELSAEDRKRFSRWLPKRGGSR